MSTSKPTDTVYCYKCGHPNASWRATCENCGAQLISVASSPPAAPDYTRPIAVTLYIGFRIPYTALSVLGALASLSFLMFFLILGQIIAAVGVWQMKQWGRKSFLVLMSIGIGLDVYTMASSSQAVNSAIVVGFLAGTLVDILFLYWLATHGDRFQA